LSRPPLLVDAIGLGTAIRDSFEFVTQNRRRHFEHADDVQPIVGRGQLDPTRQLARRDVLQIVERLGPWRDWNCRAIRTLLQRRDLRLRGRSLGGRKQRRLVVVQAISTAASCASGDSDAV
jgi:hypothetical protein